MTSSTFDIRLSPKLKRKFSLGLFLIFASFITYDVYHLLNPELEQLTTLKMEIIEAMILLTGATAFIFLWRLTKSEERNKIRFEEEITKLQADRDIWKVKHSHVINQFKDYIMDHFDSWQLTESEKEIGFFLLQGLSFKNIAEIRQVRERTIRNQALAIYSKSGLSGKHELASYFLEELLMNTRTPAK